MTGDQPLWGTAALHAGLLAAGYTPQLTTTSDGAEYVVFDYTVEIGPRAGTALRIGLQATADFPVTPPGGPQVSPQIGHPQGAVHPSPLGSEWEYWSRPAANWPADRSVRGYLRHLRTLFAQLDSGGTT
ncbi:hypothetical protein [Streptomyces sp. NRRL S-350]|uniref:hypothetical protein n=1 Tax=Streptomyces sp. NRRL S-350 TaxID=1463902 RepID=UPI0004BFEEF8|nr:hypothetical protein [Streptomyces sp. NRRL S-350]